MTDEELYINLYEQVSDLGPDEEGVTSLIMLPDDVTDEQYERVLAEVHAEMLNDAAAEPEEKP